MILKKICGEVQSKIAPPSVRFLFMFIGVVSGTLFLFATGIHEFSLSQQPDMAWSLLALALFLSLSIALGDWMFGQNAKTPSLLAALPFTSPRRK